MKVSYVRSWRTVISLWRRAAKIDVMIDIRLMLLHSPRHESQLMVVVQALGGMLISGSLKSGCRS